MPDSTDPDAELDRLAEAYTAALRRGEALTVEDMARAHPALAEEIRELFPLLRAMEGPTQPAPTPPGPTAERIGPYDIVREIGRGGMGIVYEAVQQPLGRRVALKVLNTPSQDEQFHQRFRLEAHAAGRLDHPNIVPVIDAGQHGHLPYYTMRFIEGRGLDQLVEEIDRCIAAPEALDHSSALTRRLLQVELEEDTSSSDIPAGNLAAGAHPGGQRTWFRNVARLGVMATRGLAHAHARGVLHRDLKPSNMLVGMDGRLVLADFGLCKDEEGPDMTATGDVLGSFRYMPPERFRGVSDVRGDVYGIGITLYELLTRTKPYAALHHAALAARIPQSGPASLRSLVPDLPRDLERIVSKAMAHDPAQRYATADALLGDLEAWLAGRPVRARAPTARYLLGLTLRRHKALAATIGIAAAVLIAGAVFFVVNLAQKESEARLGLYAANLAATETALRDGDTAAAKAFLEQAPAAHRGWAWRHYKARLTSSATEVTRFEQPVVDLDLSPDQQALAVLSGQTLRVVGMRDEGASIEQGLPTLVDTVRWRPDGKAVAVATQRGIHVLAWPGLTPIAHLVKSNAIRALAWSPDGTRLVCGGRDAILWWVDPSQPDARVPHARQTGSWILAVDWSSDGEQVVAACMDGRVRSFGAKTATPQWVREVATQGIHGCRFVGESHLVAERTGGDIVLLHRADGAPHEELGHGIATRLVGASSDGRRILTWNGGGLHLWDVDAARHLRRILPTGRQVSAASLGATGHELIAGHVDGSVSRWYLGEGPDPSVITGHMDDVSSVHHHPTRPLFASTGIGGIVRWWDAHTGEAVRTWIDHSHDGVVVAWSPDGRWFASLSANELVLRDMEGESIHMRARCHKGAARDLVWLPDGERLVTVGGDGALRVWDATKGEQVHERSLALHALDQVDVTPDGRQLAVSEMTGHVRLLDGPTGPLLGTFEGHEGRVTALAFGPRGERLATGSLDGTLRLWSVSDTQEIARFQARREGLSPQGTIVQSLRFTPDGQRLVSGSRDSLIRVWDLTTHRRLATLGGHQGWVHELSMDRRGEQLVSASGDATLRVWDTVGCIRCDRSAEAAREHASRLRARMEDLRAAHPSLDAREARVRANTMHTAPDRERLLRMLHTERGHRHAVLDRVWSALVDPQAEAPAHAIALGVLRGMYRAARHRSSQDDEGDTLYALALLRNGETVAAAQHARRMVRWTRERPGPLHGLALAIRALAHAALDYPDRARQDLTWLAALEKQQPELDLDRIAPIAAEARAALTKAATGD